LEIPIVQTQHGPPYEVSVQRTHSTVVIRPQLTEAEWTDIERAGDDILNKIHGSKPQGLMVDLTPLEYMGSSMVAMIVRCWKAVQPQKQRFVVVSNSKVVREVLDLSGLAKMWTIVPTIDDGLKSLGVSSGGSAGTSSAGKWTLIACLLGLAVAVVGMVLWFAQPGQRQLATGLIYGGAAGGFVLGLVGMILDETRRRFVSLGVVLACAALGVFRLVQSTPSAAANVEEATEAVDAGMTDKAAEKADVVKSVGAKQANSDSVRKTDP
jgi:anti-anti-sigma factor